VNEHEWVDDLVAELADLADRLWVEAFMAYCDAWAALARRAEAQDADFDAWEDELDA
jgi:hypothetical protein